MASAPGYSLLAAVVVAILALLWISGTSETPAPVRDKEDLLWLAAEKDTPAESIRELAHRLSETDSRLQQLVEARGAQPLRSLAQAPQEASPLALRSPLLNPEEGVVSDAVVSELVAAPIDSQDTAWAAQAALKDAWGVSLNTEPDSPAPVVFVEEIPQVEPTRVARAQIEDEAPWVWIGDVVQTSSGSFRDSIVAPVGSTFLDSRLLTSLIGRIPRSGTVRDPLPFRVVIGEHNFFSAPGHELPGLESAMASGEAVGDLLLSCVRARVTRLSWLSRSGIWQQVEDKSGLGYLTDEHGSPCIRGDLVTTLYSGLALQTLVRAVESSINGRVDNRLQVGEGAGLGVLAEIGGLRGGSQALTDWVGNRLSDSFDAVVVPAGQSVVMHLDKALREE